MSLITAREQYSSLYNPAAGEGVHVKGREKKDSCSCTIIPPHMTEKLKEAYQNEELKTLARASLHQYDKLRRRRAKFFAGVKAAIAVTPVDGQVVKVYDANNSSSLPGKLVESPATSKDAATREAYEWAFKTHEFYQKFFGRNSIDDRGMEIINIVHFQKNYNNAFWDGHQMAYGDGDGHFFQRFTIDADIGAHEMTHGVTQWDVDLVYRNQPGALNESLSDVFGSMVKQYEKNQTVDQADWIIGEEVMIDLDGKVYNLRSMSAPGTAYVNHPAFGSDPQPDRMGDYDPTNQDNGGVHINSGIPNKAFYLTTKKLYELKPEQYSHSWDAAGPIWYDARRRISSTASFLDFANATIDTAKEKYGQDSAEEQAVRRAWTDVEVVGTATPPRRPDCSRCEVI